MKPQGWQLLATGWDTSATPDGVGDVGVDLNNEFDLNGGLDQSEPQRFLSTPPEPVERIEEPQRVDAPLERPRRSRNSLWRSVIGLTLLLGSAAVLAGSFFLGEATATAVSTAAIATPAEFDTSHRKPIEDIKVGDRVLARDEHGEAIGWQEVDEIYERTSDHLRFLKVRSESGETQTFETTDEHPFWSANREAWIDAGELKAGEKLTGPDGQTHTVVFTEREEHPEGVAVYNFRVAEAHTYYVAAVDAPRGPPVLVHNATYTEPTLPNKTILERKGVRVEHYTRSNDHLPAHAHVYGQGLGTRIGANGKPLDGDRPLSAAQKTVITENKRDIRKAINQIRKWWRWKLYFEGK
ncbi:polymorphic toxin-type HINT domain-containing protein [Stratiformator vulcanicus]|uniref:Intein C-terminal splicing domain-containing protein n=1 Tax=Stratiformator vulcanicus TaxID=2527980 RepID=A0A517QWR6_9PLAN|nr:polymorphic toxin-type HINT domain-containing protein [Stratiformator vulcanicus]QDT36044.1 hypothetical protein Pan189_03990 [Stratiformator vulcanicus]